MNEDFYRKQWVIVIGSVISCLLWGSAVCCIKYGYNLFQVDTSNVFSIILFAGIRFTYAGILVLLFKWITEQKITLPNKNEIKAVIMVGLAQTTVQYFMYYVGVAHSTGVKVSLYNGTGPFLSLLVSCFIFRLEKMNLRKILGCLLGFGGVALTALDGSEGGVGGFYIFGEGFIVMAALSSGFAACFSRQFTKNVNPILLCGSQFVFGGSLMILIGLSGGGHVAGISHIGPIGCVLITYMALISSIAFGIRTVLLKFNEVSRITAFNFLTPIFGVIMSAIFLKEDAFRATMLISLTMVVIGINLVTRAEKK